MLRVVDTTTRTNSQYYSHKNEACFWFFLSSFVRVFNYGRCHSPSPPPPPPFLHFPPPIHPGFLIPLTVSDSLATKTSNSCSSLTLPPITFWTAEPSAWTTTVELPLESGLRGANESIPTERRTGPAGQARGYGLGVGVGVGFRVSCYSAL